MSKLKQEVVDSATLAGILLPLLVQQRCNIGKHLSDREIVHSLVKAGMGCNFDLCSFDVAPENVLCRMWDTSKEDAFAGVGLELGNAMSLG